MNISLKNLIDILILHPLGALGLIAIGYLPHELLPWINAAFWIGRELLQRREKGQPYLYTFYAPQVIAEWAVPSALGFIINHYIPLVIFA